MNTTLQILQGASQIGGNIVLIEGENSRLIFDFGIPLTEQDGNSADLKLEDEKIKKYLPDIADLYKEKQTKETCIFVSHAHPDHFGLLRFINKSIPVFADKITVDLIRKGSEYLYKNLFDDINLKEIGDKTETCDFIIERIRVNHSVAGACAFKITDKNSGKTVLYSGDLRAHGRETLDKFIEKCKNPDYLIMEGTTLSRTSDNKKTEKDVENEMVNVFKENKPCIVSCSPFNIDRLITVYNAVKKAGKIFVIDPYTACILESYKEICPFNFMDKNIKIFCHNGEISKKIFKNDEYQNFGKNKIDKFELIKDMERFVIKDCFETFDYLKKKTDINKYNIVYSYWEGYMNKKNFKFKKYMNNLKHIHSSGHISKTDLINVINKLTPKKIIPIHTLKSGKFKDIFGEKVEILENNEIIFI